ncbi:MAG: universal stress protein [Nitrospira sp. LK70]|nr:universal stress protein [Nitrospira sp. LK70]
MTRENGPFPVQKPLTTNGEFLVSHLTAQPVLSSRADRSTLRSKAEGRPSTNRSSRSIRILVAIDGSKDSIRAVNYVGRLLRSTPGVSVTLFHVLNPLPPVFREHGGSENPDREEQLGKQLRKDRKTWYRKEQKLESKILSKAQHMLERSGFPASRIRLKFGYDDDIVETILDEARKGHYQTIVVGRHGVSGLKKLFFGGITRRLLQQAAGCAVWVVE